MGDAIAGALGSIIGYLGAEVAQETLFERLLWPQRYYSDFSITILIRMALTMPMGGPLHRAALATLDLFRDKGLYIGRGRGNMLGTAFMRNIELGYYARSIQAECETRAEVRNGFWVEVLRKVNGKVELELATGQDTEARILGKPRPYRATQIFCHLKLRQLDGQQFKKQNTPCSVSEGTVTWQCWAGIVSSELIALGVALVVGIYMQCTWLAVYLCIPLVFKLSSVLISVRREQIEPLQPEVGLEPEPNGNLENARTPNPLQSACEDLLTTTEIFEVDDLDHGFFLIEGPPDVVLQFFRHYGHPIRDHKARLGDRTREVMAMALCYGFVLYFPAGLLALLWESSQLQYLWLGYQVYTILVMHLLRLFGWGDCGMTQVRVARLLQEGKEVWLKSPNGSAVGAALTISQACSVSDGMQRVKDVVKMHNNLRN
jgi:hypothetical protein